MPTATSFSVAYPNWNSTQVASAATAAGVLSATPVAAAVVVNTKTAGTSLSVGHVDIVSTVVVGMQTKVVGGASATGAPVCSACLHVNGTSPAATAVPTQFLSGASRISGMDWMVAALVGFVGAVMM